MENSIITMTDKLGAHPDAAIFPMLSDDELAELAADIKENGQQVPIVLGEHDGKQVIVDGRNRYAACELAGVEPKFVPLNGQDPKAFILSANIHRRHMSAGARAMATALLYPEPEKGGRGKRSANSLAAKEFSAGSLSQARTVLRASRPLADAVLAGTKSLNDAYQDVRHAEGQALNEAIRMKELRKERPDLAILVEQEEMSLLDAEAKHREEAERHRQHRAVATHNLKTGVSFLDEPPGHAVHFKQLFDPDQAREMTAKAPECFLRVAAFMTELARIWDEPPDANA